MGTLFSEKIQVPLLGRVAFISCFKPRLQYRLESIPVRVLVLVQEVLYLSTSSTFTGGAFIYVINTAKFKRD